MTDLQFPIPPLIRFTPAEGIREGARLSKMAGRHISPSEIARVLNRAGVRYVLVGAHAVNAYTGRPRATVDVDVLTDAPRKAGKAIQAAYPDLEMQDTPVVVRFMEGEHEAIDLVKVGVSKLFRRVVRLSQQVQIEGVAIDVPTVEGLLAMKFASMTSISRGVEERTQDAADFLKVLRAWESIDGDLLRDLGEVAFAGGGNEILQHVADGRAGRPLTL